MNKVQGNDRLLEEIAALNKKIDGLSVNAVNSNPSSSSSYQFTPCSYCGGNNHLSVNCGMVIPFEGGCEEVNAINQGNQRPNDNNNPYSNTYNPGWRDHPNFSWRNNNNINQNQGNQGGQYQNRGSFQNQGYNQDRGTQNWGNQGSDNKANAGNAQSSSNIEKMLEAFMQSQKQEMLELKTRVELLATQNKLLEMQVAQQASSSTRPAGSLPSKPENKEVKAIKHTLRSGTTWEDPPMPIDNEMVAKETVEKDQPSNKEPISLKEQLSGEEPILPSEVETSKESSGSSKAKDGPVKVSTEVPRYVPPHRYAPFPSRLKDDDKTNKQFSKFIEVLKQLHINLPLTEVIIQMPIYAKFFKDILSNRRRLEEVQVVSLTNLPKKLDDPGKFSIPCAIGNVQFKHALCDLGASVSLMPKSIFEKIGVGELKPTRISLQMADQSVKLPIGVVEDMSVRVGRYHIPIDFVIVDMEEDSHTPLLLGRPFLNTAKAIIDVHGGIISFTIGGDKVTFNVNRSLKYPSNEKSIFRVDVIEEIMQESIEDAFTEDPLKKILENSNCAQEVEQNGAGSIHLRPAVTPCGPQRITAEHVFAAEQHLSLRPAGNCCGPQESTLPTPGNNGEFSMMICDPQTILTIRKQVSETVFAVDVMPDFAETSKTSTDDAPKVELKPLPANLRYEYLGANQTCPVIINSSLDGEQPGKLLQVLKEHRKALGYTIGDLKGICPSIFMHCILMEDDHKSTMRTPHHFSLSHTRGGLSGGIHSTGQSLCLTPAWISRMSQMTRAPPHRAPSR